MSRLDKIHSPAVFTTNLLARIMGRAPPSDMNASVHHKFFDDKIADVRKATADAAEPTFTAAPVGCELRLFTPVTTTDVTKAIQALPDKQCLTDPLPTWLLKTNVDLVAPFLCQLFTRAPVSYTHLTLPTIYSV